MNVEVIVALALAVLGMAGLCLGQAKHFQQLCKRQPGVALSNVIRGLGWTGLLGSFAASIEAWGWAMGPVGWFGLASLAGWMVAMGLPYAAKLRTRECQAPESISRTRR